jgi:hypothetical protein
MSSNEQNGMGLLNFAFFLLNLVNAHLRAAFGYFAAFV